MKYLLVVVTHGDSATLPECLDSFVRHVTPQPAYTLYHRDAPVGSVDVPAIEGGSLVLVTEEPLGFCGATRRAWQWASGEEGCRYVFWLEHDFVFTRDVDLNDLADLIDFDHSLAQVALMRDAVNDVERVAGGLYESRATEYELHEDDDAGRWLEHAAYFTTNPSLMRSEFMALNPWPEYDESCEGRFGLDLVRRGYRFGVWGAGEPWCEHVGVRTGTGY